MPGRGRRRPPHIRSSPWPYVLAFLKDYLKATHTKGFVLGITGGQDTTLAGRLAQLAVAGLRGGVEAEFVAVRLPYDVQADEDDAQAVLDFIER